MQVKDIKILSPLVEFSLKNSLSREIFFYSWLKTQQTSGVFKNIKSEKKLIADAFGVSENTIRKYLGTLKRYGFVKIDKKGYLRLRSSYKMVRDLGISYYEVRYRKNPLVEFKCSVKDCKDYFLAEVLKDKRAKQIHSIKKVAIDKLQSKPSRKLVRNNKLDTDGVKTLLEENGLRFSDLEEQIGISRLGIANAINCKTATTGSRWVERLIKKNLIVGEVARVKEVCRGGYDTLQQVRSYDSDGVYFVKHMFVYKKMTNLIKFKDKNLNGLIWNKVNYTS